MQLLLVGDRLHLLLRVRNDLVDRIVGIVVFDRQEVETANGIQIEPSDPIDTLLRDLGITLANLQL
jgi:hypothetical protein